MSEIRERIESLLADRPEFEDTLQNILEVDIESDDGWTFDDVSIDSGQFGEIVSEGIVVKDGETYRLANSEAVRTALNEEKPTDVEGNEHPSFGELLTLPTTDIDRRAAIALAGILLLTVLIRSLMFQSVFRPEMVVLGGNDSYGYRYWIEWLLNHRPAYNIGALMDLPRDVGKKDVLFVVTMWWIAALLGGTAEIARTVLAVYPLCSAVLTVTMVYWLATSVTRDRRAGIAAALFLTVIPIHAYRVMIGFADHHAFDYVWMVVTVVGLVGLAIEDGHEAVDRGTLSSIRWSFSRPRVVCFTLLLAVGVAGNLLAWRGGPLYLVPFGIYVIVLSLSQLRDNISPLSANLPLLVGLGGGAMLTAIPYGALGWVVPYRAFLPLLLFAGASVVIVSAEVGHRKSLSTKQVCLVMGSVTVASGLAGIALVPWLMDVVRRGIALFADKGIAENASLFSGSLGSVFAPVLLFSFILFLALPVAVIGTWRTYRSHHPGLLVLVVYIWTFFVLTVVRIRFGGQLSIFAAIFAGSGFLWLADWVDISPQTQFNERRSVRPRTISVPDIGTLGSLAVLFVLISSFAAVQIPIKQSQIAIDDGQYETATWMNTYADNKSWEYPDNYVFSRWGRNRVFNYVVNGRTPDYRFAKVNYPSFLASSEPEQWYERLRGRAGFVLTERGVEIENGSMYEMLHEHGTSREKGVPGLSHYRFVHESNEGEYRVFTLVPGATLTGESEPNTTVVVKTNVSVSGRTFTYERQVRTAMTGRYAVTVPYAGRYANVETQTVTEANVTNGGFVVDGRDGGNWSLEAGRGQYVFDTAGNNHGFVENGTWVPARNGRALAFDGDGEVTVRDPPSLDESGLMYSLWFRTDPDVDYVTERTGPRLLAQTTETAYRETNGVQMHLLTGNLTATVGNGTQAGIARGPRVDDGEWHRATVSWDGETVSLYLDGERVGSDTFRGSVSNEAPLVLGASSEGVRGMVGTIDAARYGNASMVPGSVAGASDGR